MRLTRVHLPVTFAVGAEIDLPDGPRHHLIQVLRLAVGSHLLAFNGVDALEARLELISASRKAARVRVLEITETRRESPLYTTLVQAVCGSERMDYALQKCVELGVSAISPVYAERGHAPLDEVREEKKLRHWEGIVVSACEQSGRVIVPRVNRPVRLADYLHNLAHRPARVLLTPSASATLDAVVPAEGALLFFVGPEGGWSDAEAEHIERAGALAVRFGPRVLRCETAGPAFLAWAQARFGDLSN